MPTAIDSQIKKHVINQWLSGDSRDRIAADNNIGTGTVSNIVNEWKKEVEDSDYDSVRELAVYSKKEGFDLSRVAASIRLSNYVQKLGANQNQIESVIANLANSPEPEKLMDVANQIAQISISGSIPLGSLPGIIRQKEAEMQRLEEDIKQARTILKDTNVDIQTINDYKQLKAELNKHNLSFDEPERLVAVLINMKHCRYDPKKIVAEFSNIKSLKRREEAMQHDCKMLEERMNKCQSVLPLCEIIVRLGIGIGELIAFHTAVCEKAEVHNLSMDSAGYRVIEDIRDYNKLGGMKKQLADVGMQIFMMNQISGRQNNAIMALFKLQSLGIRDDQILNMCRFFEEYSRGMAPGFKQDMNYIQGK